MVFLMEKARNNLCGTTRRQCKGWETRGGHKERSWGAGSAAEASPWSPSLGCTAVLSPHLIWAFMGHFQFDLGSNFLLCSLPQEKDCRQETPTQQSTPPPPPQAGKPEKEHLKCSLPNVLESETAPEAAQSTSVCSCPSVHVLGSSGSSQARAGPSPAPSTCSVPTQTPGSPLGSCDTCSSAQASLHEVGRAITSICQSHNIPSALSKFQEVLEDSTGRRNLSAADMSYWASEQSKDLSRISKHLQGLLQQVNPMKAELEEMGKQKEKLQKQVHDFSRKLQKQVEDFSRKLQAEKDTQAEQQRKAEQSLKAKDKEHSEAVARLERDKDDLRRGTELFPASPPRPEGICRRRTESMGKFWPHHKQSRAFCRCWGIFPAVRLIPGSGSWLSVPCHRLLPGSMTISG